MNSDIPSSGRLDAPLEQLFGSVFGLAEQFAAQIGQDQVEARLRQTLQEVLGRSAPAWAAQSPEAGQPMSALVSRAGGGDRKAWNEIVDRYAPLVYSICRRYRLADHEVQDVAQEVWLLLVEKIALIREPAALPGWLATTTHHQCLRALRARPVAMMPPEDLDRSADVASIDAEILSAEQGAAIRAAFANLPPKCQDLLAMLVTDPPRSYAEISATLGIAVGSIGPTRARCLEHLRRTITAVESEEELRWR